jgi:hypothetical protein
MVWRQEKINENSNQMNASHEDPMACSRRHLWDLKLSRTRQIEAILVLGFAFAPVLAIACNSCHGYILNVCRCQDMANTPFIINLCAIILIESGLIRLFVSGNSYGRSLLIACVANIMSSAGLSCLFLIIGNQFDPFYAWHEAAYIHWLVRLDGQGCPLALDSCHGSSD